MEIQDSLFGPDVGSGRLPPNQLPNSGMEVQVLDHGYTENYEKTDGQESGLVSNRRGRVRSREIEIQAIFTDISRRQS